MTIEHNGNVRQTLGFTTAEDKYTPTCSCGWKSDPIYAGKRPDTNWGKAWKKSDDHVKEAKSE